MLAAVYLQQALLQLQYIPATANTKQDTESAHSLPEVPLLFGIFPIDKPVSMIAA